MTNNNHPVDIPKTYTVSYFDEAEWNEDLTLQEREKQELINNSYQREIKTQERGYGPCNYSNCPYSNRFYLKIVLNCGSDWAFGKGRKGSRKFFNSITMENIEEARVLLREFETGWYEVVEWGTFADEYRGTTDTQKTNRKVMIEVQKYIQFHEKGETVYEPQQFIEKESGPCLQC